MKAIATFIENSELKINLEPLLKNTEIKKLLSTPVVVTLPDGEKDATFTKPSPIEMALYNNNYIKAKQLIKNIAIFPYDYFQAAQIEDKNIAFEFLELLQTHDKKYHMLNDKEVLKAIIKFMCKTKDDFNFEPLLNNLTVKMLIRDDRKYNGDFLKEAISNLNIKALESLLQIGEFTSPNAQKAIFDSLMYAMGNPKCLPYKFKTSRERIERNHTKDLEDPDIAKAQSTIVEIISLLLKNGVNIINHQNMWDKTLLDQAAYHGYPDILLILLQNGAQINTMDEIQCTPLYNMMLNAKLNIKALEILLDHGADYTIKPPRYGSSIGYKIAEHRNSDVLKLFMKHGLDTKQIICGEETILSIASAYGNIDMLRVLLDPSQYRTPELMPDINNCNGDGENALQITYNLGRKEAVGFLLSTGLLTEQTKIDVLKNAIMLFQARFVKDRVIEDKVQPEMLTMILDNCRQESKSGEFSNFLLGQLMLEAHEINKASHNFKHEADSKSKIQLLKYLVFCLEIAKKLIGALDTESYNNVSLHSNILDYTQKLIKELPLKDPALLELTEQALQTSDQIDITQRFASIIQFFKLLANQTPEKLALELSSADIIPEESSLADIPTQKTIEPTASSALQLKEGQVQNYGAAEDISINTTTKMSSEQERVYANFVMWRKKYDPKTLHHAFQEIKAEDKKHAPIQVKSIGWAIKPDKLITKEDAVKVEGFPNMHFMIDESLRKKIDPITMHRYDNALVSKATASMGHNGVKLLNKKFYEVKINYDSRLFSNLAYINEAKEKLVIFNKHLDHDGIEQAKKQKFTINPCPNYEYYPTTRTSSPIEESEAQQIQMIVQHGITTDLTQERYDIPRGEAGMMTPDEMMLSGATHRHHSSYESYESD